MKIGIVTQPLRANYGGILQNFALQHILRMMGHEVYTFDYGKYTFTKWICLLIKHLLKKMLGRNSEFPLLPKSKMKNEASLRRFVDNNISLTTPRNKCLDLSVVNRYRFDAIIVGSDQVWRPKYNNSIKDMFLSFVKDQNIRRIAYAASFGTGSWEFTERQEMTCKALAQRFDAISVREYSAVGLCKVHLGVDAELVLDPTLLLAKEDYDSLITGIPSLEVPFLFAYILDSTDEKIEYISYMAKLMNLELVIKGADQDITANESIEDWLSCFRDANYVITDSFHGSVFSIIYNRNFKVIGNGQRGIDRMISLLEPLLLKDCLIDENNLEAYLPEKIDWTSVNSILMELRSQSIKFLNDNLK